MKKRKVKMWVKVILIILAVISVYQLFTIKVDKTTPVGSYSCKGGIIKVCTGSKRVANYLGI